MIRQVPFCAALLAAFLLTNTARGQSNLLLKDGHVLTGEVIQSTEDTVTFRYALGGKAETRTFHESDLDPHSFYEIRHDAIPDDAASHLKLAKYALQHSMFARARIQYERAKSLDPNYVAGFDAEKESLLEEAAAKLLASAREAMKQGDLQAADRDTSIILTLFADTPAAAEARELSRRVFSEMAEEEIVQTEADSARMSPHERTTLILKNGRTLAGRVLECTEDSVRFEYPTKGTTAIITFEAKDLDPHAFYACRSAVLGSDARAHLGLARFAAEHQMYTRAKAHFEIARALDPSFIGKFEKEELPRLLEGLAADLLADAKAARKRGDLTTAERETAMVLTRFADTKAAEEASSLIEMLGKELAERETAEAASASARLKQEQGEAARKAQEERLRILASVRKTIDKGREINLNGLRNTKLSAARDTFTAAVGEFQRALKQLDEIQAGHAEDLSMLRMIEDLRATAIEEATEAYVNAGSVELTRTNFQDALVFANRALALDPKNAYAQAFRARVETAAAMADRGRGFVR